MISKKKSEELGKDTTYALRKTSLRAIASLNIYTPHTSSEAPL